MWIGTGFSSAPCLTLAFALLLLLYSSSWRSSPCKFFRVSVYAVSSYSSEATSVRLKVKENSCHSILCSKKMAVACVIVVSGRVGGTHVFQEGEILVRLNLMFVGIYHHPVKKFLHCLSLLIDMTFPVYLLRSLIVSKLPSSTLMKFWEWWTLLIYFNKSNCIISLIILVLMQLFLPLNVEMCFVVHILSSDSGKLVSLSQE